VLVEGVLAKAHSALRTSGFDADFRPTLSRSLGALHELRGLSAIGRPATAVPDSHVTQPHFGTGARSRADTGWVPFAVSCLIMLAFLYWFC